MEASLLDHKGVSSLQYVMAAIRVAMQFVHSMKTGMKSLHVDYKVIQEGFASTLNTKELVNTVQSDETPTCIYFYISACSALLVLIVLLAVYLLSKNALAPGTRQLRITKALRNYLSNPLVSRLSELEEVAEALSSFWTATKPQPPANSSSEKKRPENKMKGNNSGPLAAFHPKKRSGKHRKREGNQS
jgi:hypothetical protein